MLEKDKIYDHKDISDIDLTPSSTSLYEYEYEDEEDQENKWGNARKGDDANIKKKANEEEPGSKEKNNKNEELIHKD